MMKRSVILLMAVLWILPGEAQPSYMKRADRYSSDSLGKGRNMSLSVRWIGDGDRYAYYMLDEGGQNVYYLVDMRSGRQRRLFDNDRMARLLRPYADSLRLPTPDRLGIYGIEFDRRAPLRFQFVYNGRRLWYDVRTQRIRKLPPVFGKSAGPDFWDRDYTSDSLYYMTVSRHDLILVGRGGDSVRLTADGAPHYSFASGEAASDDGMGGPVGCWIGGTHKYLAVREDKRDVKEISIIDSRRGRPVAANRKYVAAGDEGVVRHEFWLADAAERRAIRLDIDRFPDQKIEVPLLQPFPVAGQSAFFVRRSRTCDSMELCRVDTRDNSVRTVIRETTRPHLNEQLFEYHILNDGSEILWWSERSGRGRFYLYDGEGRLKNEVTDGRFVAGHVVHIDTLGRSAIVEGYGGEQGINPHYRLFYKVPLDGGPAVCLTPEDGHHLIDIAPGGKCLYDRWSRMNMPEKRRIADLSGRTVTELPGADLSEVRAKGWREPELLELLAADSVTKLYGVVYLPFEIDPNRKYPIISYVYPGPQEDLVPLAFSVDDNDNMMLAQLGFIVVHFSHRGSCPTRGRDYYNYGYGNLRDYALDDDMAVIRQVAARYVFADPDRVGIYGHSGGGFMAATAMLQHPEFYKVGVAASGNHDNNIYFQSWGETYHGVRQYTDAQGRIRFECKVPTDIELASRLRGPLLLVHGELDDNVHPASTLRLADALIRADKRFDMMIIPGADHGLPIRYFNNLVRYYFVEHLLGLPQRDMDIVKHE